MTWHSYKLYLCCSHNIDETSANQLYYYYRCQLKIEQMGDIENCYKCHQTPDDILMLICNHDLCLFCAAQTFSSQSKQQSSKKNLTCDICEATTELDNSSIKELQDIFSSMSVEKPVKSKFVEPKSIQASPGALQRSNQSRKRDTTLQNSTILKNMSSIDGTTTQFQVATMVVGDKENISKDYQSRYSVSNRTSTQPNSEVNRPLNCAEHPDEDLYYFCFTCLCQCVCPECVIHGIHRDHDVKTIKRAYPLVKSTLENTIEQNTKVLQQVQNNKEEIEKRDSQQNSLVNKFKYQIQQEFDVLHKALSLQEKVLLESLNCIPTVMERYESYAGHCRQIEQHLKSLNNTIKKQFSIKEEVNFFSQQKLKSKVLNFYSEFTKIQVPKLETLPNYVEPQTNQLDILENLSQIKKCVEVIEFKTYTKRLNEDHTYLNESLKMMDKKFHL